MPDGLVVSFTENGVQKKAVYDLKGGWNCTISMFNEPQMPIDIKDQVKSCILISMY
jgi:hypothetical protein